MYLLRIYKLTYVLLQAEHVAAELPLRVNLPPYCYTEPIRVFKKTYIVPTTYNIATSTHSTLGYMYSIDSRQLKDVEFSTGSVKCVVSRVICQFACYVECRYIIGIYLLLTYML